MELPRLEQIGAETGEFAVGRPEQRVPGRWRLHSDRTARDRSARVSSRQRSLQSKSLGPAHRTGANLALGLRGREDRLPVDLVRVPRDGSNSKFAGKADGSDLTEVGGHGTTFRLPH